jgi:hypothetical protein
VHTTTIRNLLHALESGGDNDVQAS